MNTTAMKLAPKKLTEMDVLRALRDVEDPELGLSIVDLGLIYSIQLDEEKCRVEMTLTSQGCPIGPALMSDVQERAKEATGLDDVEVRLVWDPPWDPAIMATDDAKFILGIF